ncbi:Eukaryotic and archaeal DNA primase large subunit family protein [Babesia bovis T2Bo]|uniref:Eukaryotic and archaeal DNA primase large subunit family protein n=1 Tax=Babesia bovis T2Bo TaxID=484906 RepID=UPI001DDABBFC|nr:Eukaryotic and archaeal DNA primase large subunit family protein [Babesia bovis T2Bo]EDO05827.2 Eukaryotic and archaeal DNA primase large subunit family protein [Babesia bovis T2Bo]
MSQILLQDDAADCAIYSKCFYKGSKHVICFYNEPPLTGQINLRTFQEVAAKRLAMLQYIDSKSDFRQKKSDNKADHVSDIETKMEELGFMLPNPVFDKEDVEKYLHIAQADVISHFILRLAFGRARDKRDWFLRNEVRLFEIRLEKLKNVKIRDVENQTKLEYFLQNQGILYDSMVVPTMMTHSNQMAEQMKQIQELIQFRNDASKVEKLYIAPFYPDAMVLVRNRQVALKNGQAYVPNTLLHILCSSKFRQQVQNSLRSLDEAGTIDAAKPFVDERISGFLRVLPESYLATDYSRSNYVPGENESLNLANVNSIFRQTFPPCMRRIFTHYVNSRHLKHNARRQFWLFLKGCGMSLEENIHFNRNIWHDATSFDKEHVYNIRHIYGKEGRRLSYPPLSCNAIIKSLPPPVQGQVHGCPFKELDNNGVRKMLEDFGLGDDQITPIMDLKATHQYQLACVEYFAQNTPNGATEGVGIHPNVFFQNSFKANYASTSKDIAE